MSNERVPTASDDRFDVRKLGWCIAVSLTQSREFELESGAVQMEGKGDGPTSKNSAPSVPQ